MLFLQDNRCNTVKSMSSPIKHFGTFHSCERCYKKEEFSIFLYQIFNEKCTTIKMCHVCHVSLKLKPSIHKAIIFYNNLATLSYSVE